MIDRLATAHACLEDASYHLEEADRDDEAEDASGLATEVLAVLGMLGGNGP